MRSPIHIYNILCSNPWFGLEQTLECHIWVAGPRNSVSAECLGSEWITPNMEFRLKGEIPYHGILPKFRVKEFWHNLYRILYFILLICFRVSEFCRNFHGIPSKISYGISRNSTKFVDGIPLVEFCHFQNSAGIILRNNGYHIVDHKQLSVHIVIIYIYIIQNSFFL